MTADVSAILAAVIHSAWPELLSPGEVHNVYMCKYVGADWTARTLMLTVTSAFKIVLHSPMSLSFPWKYDTE